MNYQKKQFLLLFILLYYLGHVTLQAKK